MRVGENPLKRIPGLPPYKRHRIIVPIYIGDSHAYFDQSIDTLRICLRSLFATIDLSLCSVSVINNGSIPAVEDVLGPYIDDQKIDRYVRNQVNRGKPDAVAGEIMATFEPFVTLADCDVLFQHGWLRGIEKVYACVRGVGAVSPFPAPNHQYYFTGTTWLSALSRLAVTVGKFTDDEELNEFARSIGKPSTFFNTKVRNRQYGVAYGQSVALIGAGHFVVTFRRRVFDSMIYTPKLTGASNGEADIDSMVERAGYLRLSTQNFWVRHLGNRMEDWMIEELREIEATPAIDQLEPSEFACAMNSRRPWVTVFPFLIRKVALQCIRMFASFLPKIS